MRVIAGKARRLPLRSPKGLETRPTTDRIKETLFNMISNQLPDCVFIDLFSGSGGIGIEAASRGAQICYFVENNRKAIECINSNIEFTKLKDGTRVISSDAITALRQLDGQNIKADFIFMDPPYRKGLEKQVLECLSGLDLVDDYTTIIVEASEETDFSYITDYGFKIANIKKYGNNAHVFIELI